MVELIRHRYKYFPYELELAKREVETLFPKAQPTYTSSGVTLEGVFDTAKAERLVYYAGSVRGDDFSPTLQGRLEGFNGHGGLRQSTRYSVHGLHEYKGKFNPQVVRAIFNILDIPVSSKVIDPFCGSGTSLVECAHLGMEAVGVDINPFAVFVANAKLTALHTPVDQLRCGLNEVVKRQRKGRRSKAGADSAREDYLLAWFMPAIFEEIERLRDAILAAEVACQAPLLAIASNLLRDYSLQDPMDLRIRRRKSPLPEKPLISAFQEAADQFFDRLEKTQKVLARFGSSSRALLVDSRKIVPSAFWKKEMFDGAVTSPPYATALPYIDTQRLSLVWLGLVPPAEILPLESRLVGSRETRGAESKKRLLHQLQENASNLPVAQAQYCIRLQEALGESDGFRRQSVPMLLYRYFVGMAEVFSSLRPLMKAGAPFALIVGGNHTVLGGTRFDINTPLHLAQIASARGWSHDETIPLQTYQRYGYHMDNAVKNEAMVIVRAA